MVIFKSKEYPTNFANDFPNGDAEIDKALAKLLAEKPELGGGELMDLRATAGDGRADAKAEGFEP